MKYTSRMLVALSVFICGVFGVAILSAELGRRVWSPRVFAWRNLLRRSPKIDLQPDSPLLITNPRYYSFVSIGPAVGGVLLFDVTNNSDKLVHSYNCRYYSAVRVGNGSHGSRPDEGILPKQAHHDRISAHEYAPLTLTIDFVQFADGTAWFSPSPQSTVKPEGVSRGAKAAANYLLEIMRMGGIEAVMKTLPQIHGKVREPIDRAKNLEFGIFGFYCGVTNTVVRVEHEYKNGGTESVERFLRSYRQ